VAHVSAAREIARSATAPGAAARPLATPRRADAPALARQVAARLGNEWLPRAGWTISRTGRPGLVGIALLLAAALFLLSTHLEVAGEVEALRADVATARGKGRAAPGDEVAARATAARALPARTDMPAILRALFEKATQARLVLQTGKYEISAKRAGGVVRHHVSFPVTGTYPQIRAFIDSTLSTMPAVAISDLVLERKSIADPDVEAQLRFTVYTAAAGTTGLPRASEAAPSSDRVVPSTHADALFAQRSWFVPRPRPPPPPPPTAPPPPPEPTAPPFPYAFVGSYAPEGDPAVFYLARGDRVVEARVGQKLDGVYQLESAAAGQLVFVYLPLDVRHTLAAGASK
jgi:hypothetical protein